MADPSPDTPDLRRFIEPVAFTNDRLTFLGTQGEAFVVTDDGGNTHGLYLTYENAAQALRDSPPGN